MDRAGAPDTNRVFCMVPWTHLYLRQDGRAFPCCYADGALPIVELVYFTNLSLLARTS